MSSLGQRSLKVLVDINRCIEIARSRSIIFNILSLSMLSLSNCYLISLLYYLYLIAAYLVSNRCLIAI